VWPRVVGSVCDHACSPGIQCRDVYLFGRLPRFFASSCVIKLTVSNCITCCHTHCMLIGICCANVGGDSHTLALPAPIHQRSSKIRTIRQLNLFDFVSSVTCPHASGCATRMEPSERIGIEKKHFVTSCGHAASPVVAVRGVAGRRVLMRIWRRCLVSSGGAGRGI
jgi:hypothetical protein